MGEDRADNKQTGTAVATDGEVARNATRSNGTSARAGGPFTPREAPPPAPRPPAATVVHSSTAWRWVHRPLSAHRPTAPTRWRTTSTRGGGDAFLPPATTVPGGFGAIGEVVAPELQRRRRNGLALPRHRTDG